MIKVENLSFGYPGRPLLLEDLCLTLEQGHIYGLLGRNGAGKSTLLKNLVGLAFPRAGQCLLNGQSTAKRLPSMLEKVYFLPEEVYVPALSGGQFVARTASFYPQFDGASFQRYLHEFDVPLHAVLSQLSFGQQKKFMIAFGLATNTNLLVLDEPTNGLDIPSKAQFRRLIASTLTPERCVIISTHQVRDLDNLIDTVVVLHQQRIVLNEDLEQLAEHLTFATVSPAHAHEALYAEDSMRGQQAILPNLTGRPSKIDLELLFNAITAPNQALTSYLNQPSYVQSV
ncbi:ABC transporter ATP-binding protein [Hymenobacter crusticola]|uniref:ABC transporter ATP-binding protein n=1 Tax=Hymenobacter crusticola TaxID=1770526 RepID=A0A243WAI0_9BACT|nr:ABC transporter ATP-binding protein [Hymenobacter crusticola]OUJ72473.1 ABC transporter ATP-binding protein [Hymenobacter crusticola]